MPLLDAAADLVETDELNARTRTALRDLLAAFARWRGRMDGLRHTELAEMILEESGYTEMWQADRSADAPGPAREPEGAGPLDGGVRTP